MNSVFLIAAASLRGALPLLLLLTAGCSSFGIGSRTDTFLVVGADAISAGCERAGYRELALACHRLSVGESTVVALREYENKGIDNERFRKVTLVLAGPITAGDTFALASDKAKAFYSTGMSFFPGSAGCYGIATSGTVDITRVTPDAIEMELDAVFDLTGPVVTKDVCGTLEYAIGITAQRLDYDGLGPWEGVPGTSDVVEESVPL